MDKKTISYAALGVGIILIFFGGGLLYLKEKNVKKTAAVRNPKKVEVVMSNKRVPPETASSAVTVPPAAPSQSSKTQKRKISFRYRSSKPKTVFLAGDFNKWNKKANPMKRGKNFWWETVVMLTPGEYKYAFIVDGRRINDPNNKRTVRLKTGKASVLKVLPLQ